MASETDLFYLVLLILFTLIVHLVLSFNDTPRRRGNRKRP
jgi:hypothetical protein